MITIYLNKARLTLSLILSQKVCSKEKGTHSWLIMKKDIKEYKTNGIRLLIFGYIICGVLKNLPESYDSKIYKAILKIITKDS